MVNIKPQLMTTEMVKAVLEQENPVMRRAIKPQLSQNIKPPCQIGDILYVREAFATLLYPDGHKRYVYKATDTYPFGEVGVALFRWHPSTFMPKEAARIFLRVTDVRVERLHDMTVSDFLRTFNVCPEAIGAVGFKSLAKVFWNSTVKEKDLPLYGWDANPWIWVIELKKIPKEEALQNK